MEFYLSENIHKAHTKVSVDGGVGTRLQQL